MSRADEILTIVRECASEANPMPGGEIAKKMGISIDLLYAYTKQLLDRKEITRVKIEGKPFWRFFVSEKQTAAMEGAQSVSSGFGLITDTHDIPARIAYLKHIKETTIFGEHKMLDLIIQDYERTLAMRKAIFASVEEEA